MDGNIQQKGASAFRELLIMSSSYLKKTGRSSAADYITTEPDTLVEDFIHSKQSRADKRQLKWLKKKDREDYEYFE